RTCATTFSSCAKSMGSLFMRGADARRGVTRLPTATRSGLCRSSPGSPTPRRCTKLGISGGAINAAAARSCANAGLGSGCVPMPLTWTPTIENNARKAMEWYAWQGAGIDRRAYLKRIAHHEAGHAVIARVLGLLGGAATIAANHILQSHGGA